MSDSMDLREDGLFAKLAVHYHNNISREIDSSIWLWLSRDYHAIRTYERLQSGYGGLDSFVVKFETPALKTAFVLRWA